MNPIATQTFSVVVIVKSYKMDLIIWWLVNGNIIKELIQDLTQAESILCQHLSKTQNFKISSVRWLDSKKTWFSLAAQYSSIQMEYNSFKHFLIFEIWRQFVNFTMINNVAIDNIAISAMVNKELIDWISYCWLWLHGDPVWDYLKIV